MNSWIFIHLPPILWFCPAMLLPVHFRILAASVENLTIPKVVDCQFNYTLNFFWSPMRLMLEIAPQLSQSIVQSNVELTLLKSEEKRRDKTKQDEVLSINSLLLPVVWPSTFRDSRISLVHGFVAWIAIVMSKWKFVKKVNKLICEWKMVSIKGFKGLLL